MTDDVAAGMIEALHAAAPVPAGCRLDHARGLLVEGTFSPSPGAAPLSRAGPLAAGTHPALVRFSSFGADPGIAEDDPGADPRGIGVRIGGPDPLVLLGHSVEGFPASDPAAFLAFLRSLADSAAGARSADDEGASRARGGREDPDRPRSPTSSFADLTYHTLHPYRLTAADGRERTGRLSIAGLATPRPRPGSGGRDRLDQELRSRLAVSPVELGLLFQETPPGVDGAAIGRPWPPTAKVELGRLRLERIAADQSAQHRLGLDPATLPDGIAFAGDAMIETRLAAYRLALARRLGP